MTCAVCMNGKWLPGEGGLLHSIDPYREQTVWTGASASEQQVDAVLHAAAQAQDNWGSSSWDQRARMLQRTANLISERSDQLAALAAKEMGKALWDAKTEVQAVCGKVPATIESYEQRVGARTLDLGATQGHEFRRPVGVTVIIGPANFPFHLPAGQIIPALLSGNTVVFKPSPQTAACGEALVRCFHEAGVPPMPFTWSRVSAKPLKPSLIIPPPKRYSSPVPMPLASNYTDVLAAARTFCWP